MNEKAEQLLKDILKNYDGEKEMYLNPNSTIKLDDLNLHDLAVTAVKWSNLSAQGLVCGILGCNVGPKNQCPICNCHYCTDHIKWHFHSATNTGILERDSSEMR